MSQSNLKFKGVLSSLKKIGNLTSDDHYIKIGQNPIFSHPLEKASSLQK